MFKKITASVLALVMVLGAGVTAPVDMVPDTAIEISAEGMESEYYTDEYKENVNRISEKYNEYCLAHRVEYSSDYTYDSYIKKLEEIGLAYNTAHRIYEEGERIEETRVKYYFGERSGDFIYADLDGEIVIIAYVGTDKNIIFPSEINGKPVLGACEFYMVDDVTFDKNGNITGGGGGGDHGISFSPGFDVYGFDSSDFQIESVYIPESYKIGADVIAWGAYYRYGATIICNPGSPAEKYLKETDFKYQLEDYAYTVLENGTLEITGYYGEDDIVTIPSEIGGRTVTSIGEYSFYLNDKITSVIIPDSVTQIGRDAFRECTNLTTISIPNSVTSIGKEAFVFCSGLTKVTLGNGITSIEDNTFNGCENLSDIMIPDGVTSIGFFAFHNCTNLTNVMIPNSVNSIEFSAFSSCTNMTSITIPASVERIGEYAFGYILDYDYYIKIENFKIYCYKNTAGEIYAIQNDFDYKLLDGDEDPAVSGSLDFLGNADMDMNTVTATVTDKDGKKYDVDLSTDGTYSVASLPAGDYTLTVSADGYAPREYTIKGGDAAQELDIQLIKYCDVSADGKVDAADITSVIAAMKGNLELDDYMTMVADTSKNGRVDAADITNIISVMKGNKIG